MKLYNKEKYLYWCTVVVLVAAIVFFVTGCAGKGSIGIKPVDRTLASNPPVTRTPEYQVPIILEPGFRPSVPNLSKYIDSQLNKYCQCIHSQFNTPCDKRQIENTKLVLMDAWKVEGNLGIKAGIYVRSLNAIFMAYGSRYIWNHETDHAQGYLDSQHTQLDRRKDCYFE